MEAVAILGAARPIALLSASTDGNKLVYRSSSSSRSRLHLHNNSLAAFNSASHLFLSAPKSTHPARTNHSRTRIFLPHLVASMEQVEETYIMIKPDGVQRGLVGEIISKFEKKGFKLTGLKLFQCPRELAEEHYGELKWKSFFPKLIDYITSGPVVCMAWEGVGVVASARKLIGSTNPLDAAPGTIRGDFAVQTGSIFFRHMSGGADDARNKSRLDRVLVIAVAFIGITFLIINLSLQSAEFEETRRMNAHSMRKDMMTYEMEAAKQAAEAAKSER